MSSDVVISVEGLGKKYRIRHQAERQRYTALRDVLAERLKAPFRILVEGRKKKEERRRDQEESRKQKEAGSGQTLSPFSPLPSPGEAPSPSGTPSPFSLLPSSRASREDFWALRDVSFDVKQGEVVGIIGRNGAGKSTLLKILSRITEPTEGRVRIKGRVASLLEVGTGFHPELTGRENIFLNGAILGMRREEIKRKFDEIVAFAEIEKFLDTPVKRYSSGMYVRLAFAVAAHLEPEILIVDEVLAVGDAEFQKKCLGKMGEVAKGGRTVLFVSHNMAAIQALCSKAIYLDTGNVTAIGDVGPLVDQYLGTAQRMEGRRVAGRDRLGDSLELLRFEFVPNPVVSGEAVRLTFDFRAERPMRITELALLIYSTEGARVAILDLRGSGLPLNLLEGEMRRGEAEISSFPLVEGNYRLGIYANAGDFVGNVFDLATLAVATRKVNNGHTPYPPVHRGIVELEFSASFSHQPTHEFAPDR